MCRGSHLDLKVASKDNKWFRNAALKQDRIVIETRATLNVAAMIGADMLYGEAKCFMKDTFTTWYSAEVQKQMESGNSTDEIEVDLRLSVLKPLHATWLVSLYNHLTGSVEKRHIAKGWSKAGISELVQGKATLSPEDPFENIEAILF